MALNLPINNYPTVGFTNASTLYSSLGSFWTQLFTEKGTIKGYTLGQAEELIQQYYNVLEVVDSYSSDDIHVFHKEKWNPIRIRKSEYNVIPLVFRDISDPEYAVFGPQEGTPTSAYYQDVIFKFGYPKIPVAEVYAVNLTNGLTHFQSVANRVIDPSVVLVNEVDYRINGSVVYFNKDIFSISDILKYDVFDDNGSPVQFTALDGTLKQDQEIILWAYHADIDTNMLFNNFGAIFNLHLDSTEFFKDILTSVVKLFTTGPTVQSLRTLACSFLGVTPIIEAEELVEDSYVIGDYRYVVTDKNVYKTSSYYTLAYEYRNTLSDPNIIKKGITVYAGDTLTDAAQYFDYVQSKDWWRNGLVPKIALDASGNITKYPTMAFPPHLFLGNYKYHFIFSNDYELVTMDANGKIFFPIEGDAGDVQGFNEQLNLHSTEIGLALGLTPGGAVAVNPLDFVFQNFLKSNTVLIKLNFESIRQIHTFTTFYNVIKDAIPKHVYLMFYLDFNIDTDTMELNDNTTVLLDDVATTANSDGSDPVTGLMTPEDDKPNYSGSIQTRQFIFSQGIDLVTMADSIHYRNTLGYNVDGEGQPVPIIRNIVQCNTNDSDSSKCYAFDGAMSTNIPGGSSTRDVNTLILQSFS